jgi:hypothetical protein
VVLQKYEAYFEACLVKWCELFVLTLIDLSVPTEIGWCQRQGTLYDDQYAADFDL